LILLSSVSKLKDHTNLWNQGPGSISHFLGTVFSQTTSVREQEQGCSPRKNEPGTQGCPDHQDRGLNSHSPGP